MRILRMCLSALMLCPFLLGQQTQLHSIDVSDLDRKTEPCTDFAQFSNGSWHARNPIPASQTRWSRRWQSGETAKDRLKDILESIDPATAANGSTEQIIGDYYRACMDESRVNARGAEPLKPWFAKIDGAHDMASLQRVMMELHDIQVVGPFYLNGQQDVHKPTQILADIGAAGFAMPDRDYYVKSEDRFKEARTKYLEHISKMFTLAGWDAKSSSAAAQTVLAVETKFAEASLERTAMRDPSNLDHNMTFAQLQALAPHFDWAGYFKHKQIPQDVDMNVDQPKYLQEFDRQLQQTSLADWKIVLEWNLLNNTAEALSLPIETQDFEFFGKYLSGTSEMKPPNRPIATWARHWVGSTSRNIFRRKQKFACRNWCAICCSRCATTS